MVTQSEESAFSIVGGNQSGIFVHSVSSPLHSELAEGDHVLSVSAVLTRLLITSTVVTVSGTCLIRSRP